MEIKIINISLSMYRIKLEDYKIQIVCEHCYWNGQVNKLCNKCGGKGIHNKTKQQWVVCKHSQPIDKIDRDKDGDLRYWEDMSSFYEESSKLIHFTYKDALNECKRRNSEII